MKKTITILVVIGIVVVLFFLLGPFYVVEEGEQTVVTRFGEIRNSNRDAGLKFKMPLVDNVTKYSKKILSWDGDPQRVPTAENQYIWVDATARWRITDPELFYASVTTIDQAYSRLDDVIDSSIRTIIAENSLNEAVRNSNELVDVDISGLETITEAATGTQVPGEGGLEELKRFLTTTDQGGILPVEKGRRMLSEEMMKMASTVVPDYGIELIDIVIRQIRYSDDLTRSVYERMIKQRNQIAQAYRSYGEGEKQEWLGRLDNEKRSIISKAYEESERIKGTADAEAARIYSEAYSADPNFFEFWLAVESYRNILPKFKKTLTTDMEYFDYLYNQEGR